MDKIVPKEEDVNTEIVYDAYFQDNVDTEFTIKNEPLNIAEEQGISTSQNENNCSIVHLRKVTKLGRPKGSLGINNPKRVYKQRLCKPRLYKPRPRPKILPRPKLLPDKPNRLPIMGVQLTHFTLSTEKIKEYQHFQQPFLQPGVCFKIAPKLDLCIECKKINSHKPVRVGVDCRFYHFRKLK